MSHQNLCHYNKQSWDIQSKPIEFLIRGSVNAAKCVSASHARILTVESSYQAHIVI